MEPNWDGQHSPDDSSLANAVTNRCFYRVMSASKMRRRPRDRMRAFGIIKGFNSRTIPLYPRIGSSENAFISPRYVLASKTLGGSSRLARTGRPLEWRRERPRRRERGWDTGRRMVAIQGPWRALSDETKFLGVNVQSSRRIAGLSVTAWALKWRKTAPPLRKVTRLPFPAHPGRDVRRTMSGLAELPTRAHALPWRGKLRFPSRGQGHWAVDELGNVA